MNDPAVQSGRLSVQEFVQARENEIKKLERHIANASGKKRTFQTLPRVLRRRTASHNPKRVPKRLRAKAMQEYLQDKPNSPPKRRKLEAQGTVAAEDLVGVNKLSDLPKGGKYKNRQKHQVWLPTHIWSRKRAKLAQKWGYVVPTGPTQKQYRMSHRLLNFSKDGTLAWDTSYYGTMVVSGTAEALAQLEAVFPGIGKPLYAKRSWQGIAILQGQDLGPALVFRQQNKVVASLHPAIYEALFEHLQKLADLELQDMRFAVGSFDLIGSRALACLASCVESDDKAWIHLMAAGSIDVLPYHMVCAVTAKDPRFFFPPNKRRPQASSENIRKALGSISGETTLFDEGRAASYACKSTQKEIEARKEPGQNVEYTASDPKIPVVVLKLDDSRVRVMMPWHWILPFWLSLVHLPAVYIAGTNQFEQLAFEQCLHQFPKDYPHTPAGRLYQEVISVDKEQTHSRRPKDKQYLCEDKAGSPFKCDWSRVDGTLEPVFVETVGRGIPQDNARVYQIPESTVAGWLGTNHKTATNPDEHAIGPLIGFVTSGAFNLAEARGSGVGYASQSSGYCAVKNVGRGEQYMLCKLGARRLIYL